MADEYTKPVLLTQIVNAFCTYAWAATGELVMDGITPFNMTYAIESSAHAILRSLTWSLWNLGGGCHVLCQCQGVSTE